MNRNVCFRTPMLLILIALMLPALTQPAPAHLKYFGFALVDYGIDDPNDTLSLTNYVHEVDTFCNIAQMKADGSEDTVVSQVMLMNGLCIKPFLDVSAVFFYVADNNAPSGTNYDLFPDFQQRWNVFKAVNGSVLDSARIGAFYLRDEPYWNGVGFDELDPVCSLLKQHFPEIPLMIIEAWPVLDLMVIPETID